MIVFALALAAVLTNLSPLVWTVLLRDGWLVVALLVGAAGWGAWPSAWLGWSRGTAGRQLCVAVAFGLGVLAVATLALGVAGTLSNAVAWAMLGGGWILAAWRVYAVWRAVAGPSPSEDEAGRTRLVYPLLALLALVVPLAVMLCAACLPPGILWNGEARGYDVLEYHLQAPREYYDRGRVEFLPHNVYAAFPQQMEMLYLLLMYLAGGPLAGAIPAQLLHAALGVLAVVALAAWTPRGVARWLVVAVAGSTPWLAYLGGLAYVELGVVFFASVAGGALAGGPGLASGVRMGRAWFAAGLVAGLAGGCKYTALVFVPVSLGGAALVTGRVRTLGMFALGAVVAFSPWLVRNAAFTGDPVYPFGYRWFGGAAWSTEQDEQWTRGHALSPESAAWAGRARLTWDAWLASPMFGPAVFVLAAAGGLAARSRGAALLSLWTVFMGIGWAALTQMPGRFIVPAIAPLALLGGQAAAARRLMQNMLFAVAVAGALWNARTLADIWRTHDGWWRERGVPLAALVGAVEPFAAQQFLNQVLPADASAWLIGDARAFYVRARTRYTVAFSRDAWLAALAEKPPHDAVGWLRTQGLTHVVFSWPEIERLRATYGFPAFVTRAWAAELAAAGLRRVTTPETAGVDVDTYEIGP
jgi:hypothetical protein